MNSRMCSNGDEEEDKEVGWKYLHGDVFRQPSNIPLFCAVLFKIQRHRSGKPRKGCYSSFLND
ncbi:putative nonaspanin (TM9SF) [Rosa chinensis]|uniref:Putative nonaspanin (TM9SF) n=1 Tax=Rosa chinensis TaxID=74649 RepID=A0A2P6PRE7_ROSCH|nr:putative nonaspanin (TM9SF) [Rosa chinensis]